MIQYVSLDINNTNSQPEDIIYTTKKVKKPGR